ncbi:hypothetical protein ILUMI_21878 [Ignelater luminosus]|uniref:ZAD domain-containing protein n=1 Tax=Ignelater luminosus TaxID=2038154 RepID=A0A8K0CEV2_IGNLU|nr:hypothetical protein ILUMI_21878 [Ignelater luminosus]
MMNTKITSYIKDLSSIENLCRVCLTESKTMYKLDSQIEEQLEENISNIYHVLYRVTCREIISDDRYPSNICPMCLGLLNISYKFKLQFEESHKTLTEYFGEYSTKKQEQESVFLYRA